MRHEIQRLKARRYRFYQSVIRKKLSADYRQPWEVCSDAMLEKMLAGRSQPAYRRVVAVRQGQDGDCGWRTGGKVAGGGSCCKMAFHYAFRMHTICDAPANTETITTDGERHLARSIMPDSICGKSDNTGRIKCCLRGEFPVYGADSDHEGATNLQCNAAAEMCKAQSVSARLEGMASAYLPGWQAADAAMGRSSRK